ncbi:cytochrome b [Aquitalea palustris]|nr:cytochrome b/b6 domain-containing protein [Aquitalea palustris]
MHSLKQWSEENRVHPDAIGRYSRLARILHWVFAVSIIYASIIGFMLSHIFPLSLRSFLSHLNMSVATVLIFLFPVRVLSRLRNRTAPLPNTSPFMAALAHAAHHLLYFLTMLVLASGFLMVPDGYYFFGVLWIPTPFHQGELTASLFEVHRIACMALAMLVILHIGAVLKHQLLERTPILRRML